MQNVPRLFFPSAASLGKFLSELGSLHPRSSLEERPLVVFPGQKPQRYHTDGFYSPLLPPFNNETWTRTLETGEFIGLAVAFFSLLGNTACEHVNALLQAALPTPRCAIKDVVPIIERRLATHHQKWPLDRNELIAARLVLFFFLDSYAVHTTVIIRDVCGDDVLRALIERDPHFTSAVAPSSRTAALESIAKALCNPYAHRSELFAYLVDNALMDEKNLKEENALKHFDYCKILGIREGDVDYACQCLGAYQVGKPLPHDVEDRIPRLLDLGFLKFTGESGNGALDVAQRSIDSDWLLLCLSQLFADNSTDGLPVQPSANALERSRIVETSNVLPGVAIASSLIVYNPGLSGSSILDEFVATCTYSSTNPFVPEVTYNAQGKMRCYVIRNAHLSSLSYLTKRLRKMYSDFTVGAPFYASKASARGVVERPPRLFIELDPLFQSEVTLWFNTFGKRFMLTYPDKEFQCTIIDQTPRAHGNDRDDYTSIMARVYRRELGAEEAPTRCLEWLSTHLVPRASLERGTPVYDSISGWVTASREQGKAVIHDKAYLSSHCLLSLGNNWPYGLYIAASAAHAGTLCVVEEQPGLIAALTNLFPAQTLTI